MMLVEKERKIPVLASVDVCVLGGGTTGVMAAIRAATNSFMSVTQLHLMFGWGYLHLFLSTAE